MIPPRPHNRVVFQHLHPRQLPYSTGAFNYAPCVHLLLLDQTAHPPFDHRLGHHPPTYLEVPHLKRSHCSTPKHIAIWILVVLAPYCTITSRMRLNQQIILNQDLPIYIYQLLFKYEPTNHLYQV